MAHTATEKETQSQIKLTVILYSKSSYMPRKEVVLYVPRSQKQKREPRQPSSSDTRSNKRCKVMVSSDAEYSSVTKRVVTKDSRFVYEEKCERKGVNSSCSKKMKMSNVITHEVSAINTDQYPTKAKSSAQYRGGVKEKGRVGVRTSRSGCEEKCKLKKKKKEERNARVVMQMDHSKKMQCWVILKRFMTGRDGWVFKQPMMSLEILDHHHESKSVSKPFIKSQVVCNETSMKPSSLKDIESKLSKLLYTNPDEFADDIRVVFSYGFLHPPTNDIYKITRRLSEGFELTWKYLKDKWLSED